MDLTFLLIRSIVKEDTFSYLIICMVNAVVCGGMLAVMNDACSILTLKPGISEEREVLLPKTSKMTVLGETLYLTAKVGF